MNSTQATSASPSSDQISLLEGNDQIRDVNNYTASGKRNKSHGVTYHDHVIMLYLCKFMTKKNFKFNLTCEVEEAGKFDDIVIFYEQDDRIVCRMVQVKSKDDSSKTLTKKMLFDKNNPFDLSMYFLSYLEIMINHKFEEKFNCDIEDLILHTNVDVDEELKKDLEMYKDELHESETCYRVKNNQSEFEKNSAEILLKFMEDEIMEREKVMKTIENKQNKKTAMKRDTLCYEENKCIMYFKSLTLDDRKKCIDKFLKKMKLHVKQPNKDELANSIQEEINSYLENKSVSDSNQSVVRTLLYNRVYTFLSDPKVAVLTDKQLVNWIEEASRSSMTRLAAFHDMNMNLLTTRGYSVREGSVERLKTAIERNHEILLNIVPNAETIFTSIKLNDIFNEKKYNHITEQQFYNISSSIEDDIENEKTQYLIITCEGNITTKLLFDIEDLLYRIHDDIDGICMDLKKIILISRSDGNDWNDVCTTIIDETELNELEGDAQERIEGEKTIFLQDPELKLADIDIANFSGLLNNDILNDIVDSTIALGQPIDWTISNYIERRIPSKVRKLCKRRYADNAAKHESNIARHSPKQKTLCDNYNERSYF